jgi:hypothetical protein
MDEVLVRLLNSASTVSVQVDVAVFAPSRNDVLRGFKQWTLSNVSRSWRYDLAFKSFTLRDTSKPFLEAFGGEEVDLFDKLKPVRATYIKGGRGERERDGQMKDVCQRTVRECPREQWEYVQQELSLDRTLPD